MTFIPAKTSGGICMQIRRTLGTSLLSLALIATVGWVMSAPAVSTAQSQPAQAEAQTASGKIMSVTDSSLSIEVKKGDDPNTLEFVLDKKTKVEGKLQVGATATVEYRTENAKNIATHVVVATAE
jgi:hypothetical protein